MLSPPESRGSSPPARGTKEEVGRRGVSLGIIGLCRRYSDIPAALLSNLPCSSTYIHTCRARSDGINRCLVANVARVVLSLSPRCPYGKYFRRPLVRGERVARAALETTLYALTSNRYPFRALLSEKINAKNRGSPL